jgi:hypothetical protein
MKVGSRDSGFGALVPSPDLKIALSPGERADRRGRFQPESLGLSRISVPNDRQRSSI